MINPLCSILYWIWTESSISSFSWENEWTNHAWPNINQDMIMDSKSDKIILFEIQFEIMNGLGPSDKKCLKIQKIYNLFKTNRRPPKNPAESLLSAHWWISTDPKRTKVWDFLCFCKKPGVLGYQPLYIFHKYHICLWIAPQMRLNWLWWLWWWRLMSLRIIRLELISNEWIISKESFRF